MGQEKKQQRARLPTLIPCENREGKDLPVLY
jgi:hypothetical protein